MQNWTQVNPKYFHQLTQNSAQASKPHSRPCLQKGSSHGLHNGSFANTKAPVMYVTHSASPATEVAFKSIMPLKNDIPKSQKWSTSHRCFCCLIPVWYHDAMNGMDDKRKMR